MGRISKRIIKEWNKGKSNRIVSLSEFQLVNEISKDLQNRLARNTSDPSNRIYVLMQNLLSYFAEDISTEYDFKEYYDKVSEVDDEYMPSYPPMSPLTTTYFTYWCFCDLEFGEDKESICSIFHDLCVELNFEKEMLEALKNLSISYMGLYKHLGFEDGLILLREISTGETFKCICSAGHRGKKGKSGW